MTHRTWITGVAVLALSATAAFTVLALQTPSQQAETAQTQSEQIQQGNAFVPFREILAEKLGIDVTTLEQALNDARDEFEAQLEKGNFPNEQMKGKSRMGMALRAHRHHGAEMMYEMHMGHSWTMDTTNQNQNSQSSSDE